MLFLYGCGSFGGSGDDANASGGIGCISVHCDDCFWWVVVKIVVDMVLL